MLDIEEVAIRQYNAKAGKFLVIVNDKNGYHLESRENRLAKIPLLGRIVKWYYEKKLPAVVQYLLSDVSGFESVRIPELRNKVKATIDRFFASRAHNQSPLHQRCFAAYERAFTDKARPVYQKEPIIEPKHDAVPAVPEKAIPVEPTIVVEPELTAEQKHDNWVKDFDKKHCVLEPTVRNQFVDGLKIEPEFAEALQKLLARVPNLHFYFTWPVGARPDANREKFKEAVKKGPEDALWVHVAAHGYKCEYLVAPTIDLFKGLPVFNIYLGHILKGLGFSYDHINKTAFDKLRGYTLDADMLAQVAATTKAIREMS
jgi:hypothetical protein